MKKVRVKKAPRTGEQQDYALVYNDVAPSTTNNVKPKVGNTMTATNNGNENVEVEGNEVVVGDINYDGLLELMSFQGKRHSEGGMNVHLPDGSFIYSDTPKLKIKDEEILKIFNKGKNKSGYTPAEISKQYQINQYVDILKDDEKDEISKRTANQMIKNNTEKLGMLAIVQESMKGMPNGVPDFAMNAIAGLQQPEMQEGGSLPKAQFGIPSQYKDKYNKAKTVVNTENIKVTPEVSSLNTFTDEMLEKINAVGTGMKEGWELGTTGKYGPDPNFTGAGRSLLGLAEVLPLISVPATGYELINNYRKGEPMENAFWNLLPFANTVMGINENEESRKYPNQQLNIYTPISPNAATTAAPSQVKSNYKKELSLTDIPTKFPIMIAGVPIYNEEDYKKYINNLSEPTEEETSTGSAKNNTTVNTEKVQQITQEKANRFSNINLD